MECFCFFLDGNLVGLEEASDKRDEISRFGGDPRITRGFGRRGGLFSLAY